MFVRPQLPAGFVVQPIYQVLPATAGVYLLTRYQGTLLTGWHHSVLYVGETNSFERRVAEHMTKPAFQQAGITHVAWASLPSPTARLEYETKLRHYYCPVLNRQGDGSSGFLPLYRLPRVK